MRRPLRRLHLGVWIVLAPAILALAIYAVTRSPIDRIETDAPAAVFEPVGDR